MDFLDALSTLRRRWIVLLVGGLTVVAAGLAAALFVPTAYQAAGQLVLLLPAQSGGSAGLINPYVTLNSSLTVTASLVASTVTTAESQRDVAAAGFPATYTVGVDPSSGPIIQITAESSDPAAAVATRDEVIRRLQAELSRAQLDEGVPARQLIHARPVAVPSVAEALHGSKIRVLAAIGGVGGILTLVIAFMMDGVQERRRSALLEDDEPEVAPAVTHLGERTSSQAYRRRPESRAVEGAAKRSRPREARQRAAPAPTDGWWDGNESH